MSRNLWRSLPWWGKALLILALLAILGLIGYFVLKFIVAIILGALLLLGLWLLWAYASRSGSGQTHYDKHGHHAENEIHVYHHTDKSGDKKAKPNYDHLFVPGANHKQEPTNPMRNPIKCPNCKGSGRVRRTDLTPVPMTKTCPICGGSGYVPGP